MSKDSSFVVERWTRLSAGSSIVAGVVLVVLGLAPFLFTANIVDNFTTLFIYVILAVMWNALAGYAGLVSVGQQAFFGLGAYLAIQISNYGVNVYLALLLGAVLAGILSLPISLLMLRLRAGEFAIGMWVVAELVHLLVALDSQVNGETGVSLIALNAYSPDDRRAYNYWMALAAMVVLLALVFALLRGRTRCIGAGDPGRRGCRPIRRGSGTRRKADDLLPRRLRLRAGRNTLACDVNHVPAEDVFRHSVDSLYDLYGARRRTRHFRGPDPRRHHFLPHRISLR